MIESPKNFIEQFQNFIEHIAVVMKTFLTKEVADNYYLSFTAQTLNEAQKTQARTNIGAISLSDVPQDDTAQSILLAFQQFNTENGIQ